MKRLQTLLITVLCMMLMITPVMGEGTTTIDLSGNIEAAAINVSLDTSQLILDIAAGDTSATDSLTITNTSLIPLKVSLASITHDEGSWAPTMITSDVADLNLTDAQNKAKFRFETINENAYRSTAYSEVAPVGTTADLFSTNTDGTWGESVPGVVDLGAINASPDGVVEVVSVIDGTLEVSNKRILSKVFNADMILNFEAENSGD